MKILFITVNGIEDLSFGGSQASLRNYNALMSYGDVIPYHIKKRSDFQSLLSAVQGFFPPISSNNVKDIIEILKKENIDLIFFDGSFYGKIVEKVKKSNIPMAVFYHNCEYDYINVRFGTKKSIKRYIYTRLVEEEERLITSFANYRMVFTQRDKERIENLYKTTVNEVIPIGLKDSFKESELERQRNIYCLLFGPAGTANIEAFDWFRTNVSPELNCKTLIAGKGFDDYIENWSSDKVEVKGFIDDLSELYQDALCVAIPLFSGGGMKIKTSEALMHGKFVFGTEEAFVGYEDKLNEQIAIICRGKDDFIKEINTFLKNDNNGFNNCAREVYIQNYSVEVCNEKFKKMIDTLRAYVKKEF